MGLTRRRCGCRRRRGPLKIGEGLARFLMMRIDRQDPAQTVGTSRGIVEATCHPPPGSLRAWICTKHLSQPRRRGRPIAAFGGLNRGLKSN